MKTLVLKELRENLKLAALGLIIYALLLIAQYRDYVASPVSMYQPLAGESLLWSTAWFCSIFGAVLGWLQLHNERRPDLWAFLLHRPMTRTGIFLAKTLAGLALYAVVVGVPLLCFILWALWPGHVAAPFEPAMLRPLATYVLGGIGFYFAGLLTGLRQARWYASRALGLGLALSAGLLMQFQAVWWQGFLMILIGLAILIVGRVGRVPEPGQLPRPAGVGQSCADDRTARRHHARRGHRRPAAKQPLPGREKRDVVVQLCHDEGWRYRQGDPAPRGPVANR